MMPLSLDPQMASPWSQWQVWSTQFKQTRHGCSTMTAPCSSSNGWWNGTKTSGHSMKKMSLLHGVLGNGWTSCGIEVLTSYFRFQFGGLGLLHVTDKYKRKGLGSTIVKTMAKRLALLGSDTIASVVTHNQPSLNMFQKLGFREIDEVSWIHTVPLVPSKWVD